MGYTNDKKRAGTGAVVGGVAGGVTGGMAAGAAVGGMTGEPVDAFLARMQAMAKELRCYR